MLIIGHRGAEGLMPESTIGSFKKAQELGVGMLESDLRLTKDGQIVLSHDSSLKRTCGVEEKISQMTLAEVKEVTRSKGREVLELSEFLSIVNLPVDLDVKESGFEELILKKISGFSHKVLITSWNPMVVKRIKALDKNIPVGIIVSNKYHLFFPILFRWLKDLPLYSVTVQDNLANEKNVKKCQSANVKMLVWAVNDPVEARKLKSLGIDGIFTDCPDKIVNHV